MATIPTQRDRVSPTTAAAVDPFPGRAIRAEAQRDLGRAQSIISLTGTAVNVAGQLGSAFEASKKRSAQAKFNAGLEQVSAELQAEFPDDPVAFQEQFRAHIADLMDESSFLGEEAQFAGEARMARDMGTIVQRQIALQKDEARAGLNSELRRLGQDSGNLNAVRAATATATAFALIDAEAEDRTISAVEAGSLKHNYNLTAERGIIKALPPGVAIQGIEDKRLGQSHSPEQQLDLIEQSEARYFRNRARANSVEVSADNQSADKLKARQDAAMIDVELRKLNGTLTPEDVRPLATLLDPSDFRIAVNTTLEVNAPADDATWMQQINTAIDENNTAMAKFLISEALLGGVLTPSTADSFRRVVRTRSEDLSPVQKRGLSLIRESLAPPPGARSEAIIYQQARLNASVEYLKQLELNPVLASGDIDKMAQDIVQRFSVFVTSDIVETFGLPVEVLEVNPDLNQDTVTVDDFISAGEITNAKHDAGLMDTEVWRQKVDRLNLWTDEIERRNKAEKKKAEKGTRRGR